MDYSLFRKFKKSDNEGLNYHSFPMPGKIAVALTKPLKKAADFGLAYTPGVAEPCKKIHEDVKYAFDYTAKWNTVAVVSDGSAVLGLGNIGPEASKPVMEGKSALFKYLSGIDSFDLEVNAHDADSLSNLILNITPGLGGINLEDVAAPICFDVDKQVRAKAEIPFFHDDQNGTSIVAAAAVFNSVHLTNKDISKVKIVCNGAGAAAIAVLNFLVHLGVSVSNCSVFDSKGMIHKGRPVDAYRGKYAQDKELTLREAMKGADIFIGLSVGNVLDEDHIKSMSENPIVFAMANPVPEILPSKVKAIRSDAIVGSGRSDFENQVNNVLCFPFIFRGALDVRAKEVNLAMQKACCSALCELARDMDEFGKANVLPGAFDPLLIYKLSKAVADAAIESGVASCDLPESYSDYLDYLVYGSVLENVYLPKSFEGDDFNYVKKIFAFKGIEQKSSFSMKPLNFSNLKEDLKGKSGEIVFDSFNVSFGSNGDLQTSSPEKVIEGLSEKNQLLGVILEEDKTVLFNTENRPWFGVKLFSSLK